MQSLNHKLDDFVLIDLNPPPRVFVSYSLDESETADAKILRILSEHPVVIFTRSVCCMCHVMKKLLTNIKVYPAVIELEDHEILSLPPPKDSSSPASHPPSFPMTPVAFIGGARVGGLESLVALHVRGHLIPKLAEVGAVENEHLMMK